MLQYNVHRAVLLPEFEGKWDSPAWKQAERAELTHFRPEGSDHRPKTSAKLLYDRTGIFGLFRVQDRYVRSVHTEYQSPVYRDSCVEFFIQPKPHKGYFNFEFNCGGALLSSYITDSTRVPGGFRDLTNLSEEDGRRVIIFHSLPHIVSPERTGPTLWSLEFFVPFSLLEKYVGPLGDVAGESWSANFYKCGDETSHPHWSSWMPLPEKNFHLPGCFGTIFFDS